jgi:trk system potassium uptake protein TrkH
VYLVMILFFPERKLSAMKSVLGGGMLRVKELLVTIVVIFTAYTIALISATVFLSQTDVLDATSLVFSTITSGGFIPDSSIINPQHPERMAFVSVGMILSALPFAFHYYLFTKAGLHSRKTITLEVAVFFVLITLSIPTFFVLAGGIGNDGSLVTNNDNAGKVGDIYSAAFHVISAATTTGFQYLDIHSASPAAKIFLIIVMLVGGTAFSIAGGIKIGRFITLYQEFHKKAREKTESGATVGGASASGSISSTANPFRSSEFISRLREGQQRAHIEDKVEEQKKPTTFLKPVQVILGKKVVREILVVIALYVSVSLLTGAAIAFLTESKVEDSLFESVSAVSTTGLTAGVTSVNLDSFSKLMLTLNMIVGRFEIIALLYIFFSYFRK